MDDLSFSAIPDILICKFGEFQKAFLGALADFPLRGKTYWQFTESSDVVTGVKYFGFQMETLNEFVKVRPFTRQ